MQCKAVKVDGTPCKMSALKTGDLCKYHAKPATVSRDPVPRPDKGKDFSAGLCDVHFPDGWPSDAKSAGCVHGYFERELIGPDRTATE
jgi:hypothetical protein